MIDELGMTLATAFPHLAHRAKPRIMAAFELSRDVPDAGLHAGDTLLYGYAPRKVGRYVRVQPIEVPRAALAAVAASLDALRIIDAVGPSGCGRSTVAKSLRMSKPDAKGVSPLHVLRPPTSITADCDAIAVELLLLELGGAAAG